MGSALWKNHQQRPGEWRKNTNSGASQDKKNKGDRFQLVIERNENPNYVLQERFIKGQAALGRVSFTI
jgi:hypothetical protein